MRQRLAALDRYPWYDVECDTANDFMSYLAASLGQVNSIDSSPVTDNGGYLRRLALAGVSQDAVARQLDALRIQVLDHILPVPPPCASVGDPHFQRATSEWAWGFPTLRGTGTGGSSEHSGACAT